MSSLLQETHFGNIYRYLPTQERERERLMVIKIILVFIFVEFYLLLRKSKMSLGSTDLSLCLWMAAIASSMVAAFGMLTTQTSFTPGWRLITSSICIGEILNVKQFCYHGYFKPDKPLCKKLSKCKYLQNIPCTSSIVVYDLRNNNSFDHLSEKCRRSWPNHHLLSFSLFLLGCLNSTENSFENIRLIIKNILVIRMNTHSYLVICFVVIVLWNVF